MQRTRGLKRLIGILSQKLANCKDDTLNIQFNEFQDSTVSLFVLHQFQHFWYQIEAEIVMIQMIQFVVRKIAMMQLYVIIDPYIQRSFILQICITVAIYILHITSSNQKEYDRKGRKSNEKNMRKGKYCGVSWLICFLVINVTDNVEQNKT